VTSVLAFRFAVALLQVSAPSAEATLPEAEAFLEGLAERQRRYEQALDDYTYDVEVVEEKLDEAGRVTSRKTSKFEVFFVKGRRVRRLVEENGVPLAGKRQAEVDEKVRERVEDLQKDKAAGPARGSMRLSEVLERYDFRSIAREPVDGRSAILMEFSPKPGKSALRNDKLFRSVAGRIWVDEAERVVARVEMHNTAGIKIALGLLASIKDADVGMDFCKVDDVIWVPRRAETRVTGRLFLFKGIRARTVASFSGYRRFQVESEERARLPKPPQP
jgi:hypothetical protein